MLSTAPTLDHIVQRTDVHLRPDPSRVVAQLFVPGEELASGRSRASPVMQRVLALGEAEAEAVLADTVRRFEGRHPDLMASWLEHFDQVGDRLGATSELSTAQRLLLGSYATAEFAVEAAALCNPSIVAHPDQGGLSDGDLRFVLSLRAIGEGHLSSIEFRTGVVGPEGQFRIDDPGPLLVDAKLCPSSYDRTHFQALLNRSGYSHELISLVMDALPAKFSESQLEASIHGLNPQVLTRDDGARTVEQIRQIARGNYTIAFPPSSGIGQRVVRPHSAAESQGIEDARFVRFVEDDGSATYYATYTAFNGAHIAPQLLQTDDFCTFRASQLTGRAATNKGLALFPRQINGRYVALSRWDRESNAVATSADLRTWDDPVDVQAPEQSWELIQLGNCGSPIETAEGWLVITHGVGPMRTYSLGAVLLDLDDPTRVRAKLATPLLTPDAEERNGYVPNVVYSCGALVHEQTLVLPYAYSDIATSVALVCLPELVDLLLS